jgi:hypothetical protein
MDGRLSAQNGLLGQTYGLHRIRGNSSGERLHEPSDLVRLEYAVQVTPAFRRLGIQIVTTQHDFQSAPPAHQPRQPLGSGPARKNAERHLHLVDLGPSAHSKTHVEARRQLAATTADAPFDLRDGHLVHGPEPLAHDVILGQLG